MDCMWVRLNIHISTIKKEQSTFGHSEVAQAGASFKL